jgi:hypothetical protein
LNSTNYRYGYNGQEKSLEIDANGNHHTAEFWEVDNRILRRWNLDPVLHEWRSDYSIFGNNPILLNDPNGDDTPLGDFDTPGFWSGVGDAFSSVGDAFGNIGGSISDISEGFYNALSGNSYLNDANRFCDENGISRDQIKHETTIEIQSDGSEKDLGQKFASVQTIEDGATTSRQFYKGGYRDVRGTQYDVANAYLRNGKENPFFRGDGLEDNNMDIYFVGALAGACIKVATSRIAASISARAAATNEMVEIIELMKVGNLIDRGGLTSVGRALQKHGSRPNSAFPNVFGNPSSINVQGETVLNNILNNPNVVRSVVNRVRYGGNVLEYKIPGGQGVRFTGDGKKLIGFLEP